MRPNVRRITPRILGLVGKLVSKGSLFRDRIFRGRIGFSAVIWGVVALAPASALAGPPPIDLPGAVQPGHDRPLPQPVPPPDFDFSVEAPHRSPVPRAVDEIHFKLADIRVVGATTLRPESFRPLYAGLIGKDVSLANIYDVADAIENAYRVAGFLLVRAYVPPQHVKDGIFTIKVVEGFVESTVRAGRRSGHAAAGEGLSRTDSARPPAATQNHRAWIAAVERYSRRGCDGRAASVAQRCGGFGPNRHDYRAAGNGKLVAVNLLSKCSADLRLRQ